MIRVNQTVTYCMEPVPVLVRHDLTAAAAATTIAATATAAMLGSSFSMELFQVLGRLTLKTVSSNTLLCSEAVNESAFVWPQ